MSCRFSKFLVVTLTFVAERAGGAALLLSSIFLVATFLAGGSGGAVPLLSSILLVVTFVDEGAGGAAATFSCSQDYFSSR